MGVQGHQEALQRIHKLRHLMDSFEELTQLIRQHGLLSSLTSDAPSADSLPTAPDFMQSVVFVDAPATKRDASSAQ